MRSQKEYWNSVADTKEFTTPMQSAVFCRYVNRDAAILDVGCGYGRVLNELHGLGFSHLRGIDFSEQLIRRGKRQFPFLDLQVQEAETIDAPDGTVDAVLLCAVLTCIVSSQAQEALIREIRRVLRPGGLLYVNDRVKIHPIIFGGGQQRGLRSGTENVPGIAGLAKAAEEVYAGLDADTARLYELKQRFIDGVLQLPDVQINGLTGRDSAPHVISVSFRGVRSEVLLHALEDREIYVSAGSACSSNRPETAGSATLRAIGLDKELLGSTLRFSLSVFTTREEIDYTLHALHELVPMLRRFTRR